MIKESWWSYYSKEAFWFLRCCPVVFFLSYAGTTVVQPNKPTNKRTRHCKQWLVWCQKCICQGDHTISYLLRIKKYSRIEPSRIYKTMNELECNSILRIVRLQSVFFYGPNGVKKDVWIELQRQSIHLSCPPWRPRLDSCHQARTSKGDPPPAHTRVASAK